MGRRIGRHTRQDLARRVYLGVDYPLPEGILPRKAFSDDLPFPYFAPMVQYASGSVSLHGYVTKTQNAQAQVTGLVEIPNGYGTAPEATDTAGYCTAYDIQANADVLCEWWIPRWTDEDTGAMWLMAAPQGQDDFLANHEYYVALDRIGWLAL